MSGQHAGGRSACRLLLSACLVVALAAAPAAAQLNSTVPAPPAAAQRNTTAGEVLLGFREGISNWAAVTGDFQGWTNATQETCSWTGVACNNAGEVTGLSLQGVGLVGALPAALGSLEQLQILNLANNQLSGPLPDTWGSVNASFSLQQLLLSGNQLDGGLPSEWGRPGRWPALTSMQLGDNNLTGGLPTTWSDPDAFANLTDLDLSQNALKGTLSPFWGDAGGFISLENLDLSNNSFSGQLPLAWGSNGSFPVLVHLLLSNNSLSGTLPGAWGTRGRWPLLAGLYLQNNDLTGGLPAAWAASTAFPKLGELLLRPGNAEMCGPLPATTYTVQYMSSSGAAFPLTGTLGSCAQACGSLTTSSNATNLFDISVEAQVALADLLQFNPSADVNGPVAPGTSLTRPCYPANEEPTYLGGNIAYGKVASQSTTVGAGRAGRAVAFPAASTQKLCSLTRDGTKTAPAWWSLDLGVSTDIVGLVIAAQTAVGDLKIAIGDNESPLTNAECSVGVQIEANATSAQVCNGKGRYLTLSRLSGAAMSLCGVEVFPVAASAASSKQASASGGTGAYLVSDGADSGCSAVSASTASGPWVTVDLGYRGQFAAIGVDLGQADLTELNLRVGNKTVVTGTENPLCLATIANLPGYSKTLFGCTASGRYLTAQAPTADSLDVCLLSAYLQDAPSAAGSAALTPSSELTLAPGPAVDLTSPTIAIAPAPEPAGAQLAPDQIVLIQFRLVLIGPYVVNFDGKEDAVINALKLTLQPVDPIAINITSYTVGAPVPSSTPAPAPAPAAAARAPPQSAGRRLSAMSEAAALHADEADSTGAVVLQLATPRRRLHQQVSEGAVIINVQVRTTAAKEADTTQLMETSVANGTFTKALQSSGLDAQAVRLSVGPSDGAPAPADVAAPGAAAGPGADSAGGGGGGSNTAAIAGGVIGGLAFGLLLAALVWFWLVRRRRRRQSELEGARLAAGGKGDIESASETGSSSGGGYAGSGGRAHTSWWPFSRRSAKQRASVDSSGSQPLEDSPGGMYSSKAFPVKGTDGSAKAERPVYGQVHAHAGSGAATPLGMASQLQRTNQQNGSSASLQDAPSSVRDAYSMPGTPGGTSVLGGGGTDTPGGNSDGGLLLPVAAFMRSNSSGLLGSPSGWETPLGMGGHDPQMGLQGPLGQLQRGVSDVVSEVEVINEDDVRQRWTATSAELWPIMYKELTFLKQIGEGSFGRVYMARWRETTVAVKVLHRQTGDHLDDDELPLDPCPSAGSPDPILNALQKEAGIMASVRHPNVISYLGVCAEPACIVTEYCSKGSLTDVLRRGRASLAHRAALDWPRRLNMAMDAAKGMLHLHLCDPPIIHRDLKSPNLLVDKHWKLKVCDFNLSRVMEESVVLSSMVASNPRWLAPEILAGLPYTVAADVYSFGVIMWELLTWEVPWHQQNTWQVHAMVTGPEHLRPDVPADIGVTPGGTFGGITSYLELMRACWAQSPDDRPDFETVIGRLRRMLAVETLARQPSVAGSSHGSPSRQPSGHPLLTAATASAPHSASSPLATR